MPPAPEDDEDTEREFLDPVRASTDEEDMTEGERRRAGQKSGTPDVEKA